MEDVNDNHPVFSVDNPSINVDEGSSIGFVFYTCSATDRDTGPNSRISYSITNSSGPFKIDSKTGKMSTNGTLDYESIQSYDVFIKAEDHGEPKLFSIVKMSIGIRDENDNPPLFQNSSYLLTIKEDAPLGAYITRFLADDRDSNTNGLFFFHIDDLSPDARLFTLSEDGTLSLGGKLDRETKDSYTFKVVVQDKGTPFQRTSARVGLTFSLIFHLGPVRRRKTFYVNF